MQDKESIVQQAGRPVEETIREAVGLALEKHHAVCIELDSAHLGKLLVRANRDLILQVSEGDKTTWRELVEAAHSLAASLGREVFVTYTRHAFVTCAISPLDTLDDALARYEAGQLELNFYAS